MLVYHIFLSMGSPFVLCTLHQLLVWSHNYFVCVRWQNRKCLWGSEVLGLYVLLWSEYYLRIRPCWFHAIFLDSPGGFSTVRYTVIIRIFLLIFPLSVIYGHLPIWNGPWSYYIIWEVIWLSKSVVVPPGLHIFYSTGYLSFHVDVIILWCL